jgi:hypothetical protein
MAAPRGSKKRLSQEHEDYIARLYGGRRSPSSGGQAHDAGDVRTKETLFECKGKFGERVGAKPVKSTLVDQFEKITDEAYEGMREPAVTLRFYMPDSKLADGQGFVDLVVRLAQDDAGREMAVREYTESR